MIRITKKGLKMIKHLLTSGFREQKKNSMVCSVSGLLGIIRTSGVFSSSV